MTDSPSDTPCKPQAHGQAVPLSSRGPCQLCGRARCWQPIRHGVRKGERCRHNPTPGGSVCVYHGANADERAAGRRRAASAKLEGSLMGGVVEPVTDAVGFAQERLGRLARAIDSLDEYVGSLTDSDGGRRVWSPELQAQLAAQTALLREARRWSTDLARLGLEDRAVSVLESQAELMGQVEDRILAGMLAGVLRALADAGVEGATGVVERVWPGLVSEVVPAEWAALEQGGGE